jgi:hypothetical protein
MPTCFFLLEPNAGPQARREAGAQRTLYAVACRPLLGTDVGTMMAVDVPTCQFLPFRQVPLR